MHNQQYQHGIIYMLEQIPPKKGSAQKVDPGEENSSTTPARNPIHALSSVFITSLKLYHCMGVGVEGCCSTTELSIIHAPQFDEYLLKLLCTTDQ